MPLTIINQSKLNNEAPSICGPCGGRCCKTYPGIYVPQQFGRITNDIISNIESFVLFGLGVIEISIDWILLDEIYIVRPKMEEEKELYVGLSSLYSRCINLHSDFGCQLTFQNRPMGCQQLVPNNGGHGKCHGTKEFDGLYANFSSVALQSWREIGQEMEVLYTKMLDLQAHYQILQEGVQTA